MENNHNVTNRELKDKLDKLRWEMRFLILAGLIGSQIIPVQSVVHGAMGIVQGVFQ